MYRILKGVQADEEVVAAGTDDVFQVFEFPLPDKKAEPGWQQEEEPEPEEQGPTVEEQMVQEMIWKAEALLERAKEEADEIRREAYDRGFEEGREDGKAAGRKQAREEEEEQTHLRIQHLEEEIAQYVADMNHEKEKILEEYLDDLKNISLAIGEKIVQTSLKSSSEVIKRMIIAATEKLKKTAWARIYVAKTGDDMEIQGDAQLLRELAKLSDNVKIVIMEDTEPGTCIIELPQEIIDISTGTQMENIRDILNNARL
ncbi:MAG: hypothetical protein HFE76_00445 [Firmicutes bacterium]|nr:hypothetical protein [Bacillota bacterium]